MEFINLSKKRCYLVRCSDWSTIIEADNESEACSLSLVEMLAEEGKNLKLSSVMSTTKLVADIMDEDIDKLHDQMRQRNKPIGEEWLTSQFLLPNEEAFS